MHIFKKLVKIIAHTLFVINFIYFSTLHAKNLDKFNKADNISNYFSGIVLLNQSKYEQSYKYLKKLDGLEEIHSNYSTKNIYSLINSGNFHKAFDFVKRLDKKKQNSFEGDIIMGIYYLKNAKNDLASQYFLKAKKFSTRSLLDEYISNTLYIWSSLRNSNLNDAKLKLNNLDNRFQNLKKIQSVFLHCFFNNNNTENLFDTLTQDSDTDFSRYNYFYAKYLQDSGKKSEAKKIVEQSLIKYPRNLLLNQYKIDLYNSRDSFSFNCKQEKDIVAEIFYIASNALSSQSIYPLSNFYLNLAKYLNKDFHAFNTLLAENLYMIKDYSGAKEIYEQLSLNGNAFKWYSKKQIARILIQEKNKNKSLSLIARAYDELPSKGIYETYDYAEFLKNNEEFKNSILYYSDILEKINRNHPLYPKVKDSRGVSYERIGEWDKAEKDLLASLEVSPNQAYVINYLAYTWIEQGIKIEKSLKMLEKANKIKSNDPYIIDSLGWALYKLKRYEESKDYLQLAVKLMPADPIVNDHYGDVLWQNGNEIQARYYWKYVLNLEKAEKDLKEKIEQKLIKGL